MCSLGSDLAHGLGGSLAQLEPLLKRKELAHYGEDGSQVGKSAANTDDFTKSDL